MSEPERLERAAVQLAWETSSAESQARWVAPVNVWKSMKERRRNRFRRMAAAVLAAADGKSVEAG